MSVLTKYKCTECAAPPQKQGLVIKAISRGEVGYYVYSSSAQCNHRPQSGWICTREAGHSGLHAGHTTDRVQQATWGE